MVFKASLKELISGFDKRMLSKADTREVYERDNALEASKEGFERRQEAKGGETSPVIDSATVSQITSASEPQFLNGAELTAPRLHSVNWADGQRFTEHDDPDRTNMPWAAPEFVRRKDPAVQTQRMHVEELDVSGITGTSKTSFARVVYGLFEPEECAELLARVNEKGFTPALLNIGRGMQQLAPGVRDGQRVIVDSPELTGYLFELLKQYLPATLRGSSLVELNERARFLCYTPGQQFDAHCDGRYTRMQPHPNAGDYSMVTVQFYLHDVPQSHGGATTFLGSRSRENLPCQPVGGSALIFTQDLLHEGSLVTDGLKYTLRTEAMYRRPDYSLND